MFLNVEQRILHQQHIPDAANFSTQVVNLPTETGSGEVSHPPPHTHTTLSAGPACEWHV